MACHGPGLGPQRCILCHAAGANRRLHSFSRADGFAHRSGCLRRRPGNPQESSDKAEHPDSGWPVAATRRQPASMDAALVSRNGCSVRTKCLGHAALDSESIPRTAPARDDAAVAAFERPVPPVLAQAKGPDDSGTVPRPCAWLPPAYQRPLHVLEAPRPQSLVAD